MTSNLNDERGGLPSASNMTRIIHCPASLRLNADESPESSAAADEGTMLHKVCELELLNNREGDVQRHAELNDEQQSVIEWALSVSKEKAKKYVAVLLEQRLWAKSKLFSGKADVLLIDRQYKHAVIIDYKFGRGDVEPAERNYQLAAMAVLAFDNYEVETVEAMIIQPRTLDKDKRITECTYDIDDLRQARDSINNACQEALYQPNPSERCGYWCKYCPSVERCQSFRKTMSEQLQLATANAGFAINELNARKLYEDALVVKKYCDDIIAAVKDFVFENPTTPCGLTLADGAKRSKLGDAAKIYEAVESVGITPQEFVGVCEVGMTKLQTLYHSKRKLVNEKQTKKASDIEVKQLLQNSQLLTYSQTAPTLKLLEGK